MKSLPVTDLAAALAFVGLALGIILVAGPGWALIVCSALALIYIVLPDQKGPTQ